jgi:hypothetical protein
MFLAMPVGSAVDTHVLLQTVWVGLAAGIGVAVSFSFVVLGAARVQEARERGNMLSLGFYGLLAALSLLFFLRGIVVGLIVMTNK